MRKTSFGKSVQPRPRNPKHPHQQNSDSLYPRQQNRPAYLRLGMCRWQSFGQPQGTRDQAVVRRTAIADQSLTEAISRTWSNGAASPHRWAGASDGACGGLGRLAFFLAFQNRVQGLGFGVPGSWFRLRV